MKILDLPLKKQWYDMIANGTKRQYYSKLKTYISAEAILNGEHPILMFLL